MLERVNLVDSVCARRGLSLFLCAHAGDSLVFSVSVWAMILINCFRLRARRLLYLFLCSRFSFFLCARADYYSCFRVRVQVILAVSVFARVILVTSVCVQATLVVSVCVCDPRCFCVCARVITIVSVCV